MHEIYENFEIKFDDFNIQYISSYSLYRVYNSAGDTVNFKFENGKDYLYNIV